MAGFADVIAQATATLPESEHNAAEQDTTNTAETSTDTEQPAADETVAAETPAAVENEADPVADAQPDPTKETATPQLSEKDELAKIEAELLEKNPTMRNGRIGISRHQAVLTRQRNLAQAEYDKRFADAMAPFEALKKYGDVTDWQNRLAATDLIENQPRTFLREVLTLDPRYVAEIEALVEERLASRGQSEPQQKTAEEVIAEMPAADRIYDDGSKGYTDATLKKVLDWHGQQIERAAEKKFDAKLEEFRKQVAPMMDREAFRGRMQKAAQRVRPILENARKNWRGFADNEAVALDWMRQPGNESASIHDAYIAVVLPKLLKSQEEMEKAIHAKAVEALGKGRPTTAVAPRVSPAIVKDPNAARQTSDVIREAMRSAGM